MSYKVYLPKDIQRDAGLIIDSSLIPDEGPLEEQLSFTDDQLIPKENDEDEKKK